MKIAVVVAAHDGIVSLVTGVGVVVNSFIESFGELRKEINILKGNEVNLICIPPYLERSSPDFNENLADRSKDACLKTEGYLMDLPTFSDGKSEGSIWGEGIEQWKSASLSAATFLKSIERDYDKILLFAHDTIFASVRNFLPEINNLNIIWVPHSLGKTFQDEYSNRERILFEEDAIISMMNSKKDYVGYIGNYFKKILLEKYNVFERNLINLKNGLYENSQRYTMSTEDLSYLLDKYKIPRNKKLIFSWGRCVYQKGFDILIPSCKEFLENNSDYHIVLLMPIETSLNKYVDEIKIKLLDLNPTSFTAIYKFEEYLPSAILSLSNLEIIVFPSRFEGAAITALEANAFAADNVKIIYSSIQPNKDVFDQNSYTIPFKLSNSDALKNILENVPLIKKDCLLRRKKENMILNYSKGLNDINLK